MLKALIVFVLLVAAGMLVGPGWSRWIIWGACAYLAVLACALAFLHGASWSDAPPSH